MNRPILSRVKHICSSVLSIPLEQITLKTSPDNIENWDSINHLNLVLAIEHTFAIQLTPEEIEQLLSVELITELLEEKLAATG